MKTVVLLSGGIDSATTLAIVQQEDDFDEALALAFAYGQRHAVELESAKRVSAALGVPLEVLDLGPASEAMAKGSLRGTEPIPHGHYQAESMRSTVVPNRNAILLSLAVAVAERENYDAVAYGAHSGDHAIYPDCRPEFVEAMANAIWLSTEGRIELLTPLLHDDKAEIVARAHALDVPLGQTWTCYDPVPAGLLLQPNRFLHCGKCGSCVERREAFEKAGVTDPTAWAP